MSERMTPLEIAQAFTHAWTSHDISVAAQYVDDAVVFDGPLAQTMGREAYLKGLTELGRSVTGFQMIAAFGDETQALLMYDLLTNAYGTLSCAKHLTISNGRIVRDKLTFDSHQIRSARAA